MEQCVALSCLASSDGGSFLRPAGQVILEVAQALRRFEHLDDIEHPLEIRVSSLRNVRNLGRLLGLHGIPHEATDELGAHHVFLDDHLLLFRGVGPRFAAFGSRVPGPSSHLRMFLRHDLRGEGIEELLDGPFGEACPDGLHDPELVRRDLVEDTRLLGLLGHGLEQRVQLVSLILHLLVGLDVFGFLIWIFFLGGRLIGRGLETPDPVKHALPLLYEIEP